MQKTRQVLYNLWTNSPRQIYLNFRNKYLSPTPAENAISIPGSYFHDLLSLFWEYLSQRYPGRVLPQQAFIQKITGYKSSGAVSPFARFFQDLYILFQPDYTDHLPAYYANTEYLRLIRFLEYANDVSHIHEQYAYPYSVAREKLGTFTVLEIGGGLPHGFIQSLLYESGATYQGLTVVEIPALYVDFTRWLCARQNIPFTHIEAVASQTPHLPPDNQYDFIFAKDIFEHLDDPARMIAQILTVASPRAILALDLVNKPPGGEHISPTLAPLHQQVVDAGYQVIGQSGIITLFQK